MPASARSAKTCAMQVADRMRLRHGCPNPPGIGSHGIPICAWSESDAAFSTWSGVPPAISQIAAAAIAPHMPHSPVQPVTSPVGRGPGVGDCADAGRDEEPAQQVVRR